MSSVTKKYTTLLIISCIFLVAFIIQANLYLHQDVTWHLHVAERMLAGGTYTNDFFDPDPPMIFYLYFPAVAVAHFLKISMIWPFTVYVFILSFISLGLCYVLGKNIFKKDIFTETIFLIVLAVAIVIAPMSAFAQREHFFVILIMPFLLAKALQLDDIAVNKDALLMIGIMAGLGFAIKPFFLLTLVLVEAAVVIKQKKLSLFRPEMLAIGLVLLVYAISTPLLFPDYFSFIIPHAYQFFFADNFFQLQRNTYSLNIEVCLLSAMILFVSQIKHLVYSALSWVMFLSTLSAILFYVIQGGGYLFYHLYPAFAFSIILLGLLFSMLVNQLLYLQSIQHRCLIIACLVVVLFWMPFSQIFITTKCFLWDRKHGQRQKMIVFMQSHSDFKTCYFITPFRMAYPMVDYANLQAPSRYYNFATLTNLLTKIQQETDDKQKKALEEVREELFQKIENEMKQIQPDLIFVDLEEISNIKVIKNRLLLDKNMHGFWRDYRAAQIINDFQIYVKSKDVSITSA